MRLRSVFAVALLVFMAVLAALPQSVSAQDITATPDVGVPTEIDATPTVTAAPLVEGISFPQSGMVLRGVVDISGTAFSGWVLSFSYQDNPTDTWFVLDQSAEPVSNDVLASWDTSEIADGRYLLRLRLLAVNGSQDMTVKVQVGNQLPDVTATATAVRETVIASVESSTPVVNETAETETVPVLLASPTMLPAFPANPAVLKVDDILINLGKGVLFVVIVFGFAGIVLFLRRR